MRTIKLEHSAKSKLMAQYEVYIEPNLDRWRGGFEWAIIKAGAELDCGLSFSEEDALYDAHQRITELCCAENQP